MSIYFDLFFKILFCFVLIIYNNIFGLIYIIIYLCILVTGGYYTIEQKEHKLRIVALNTNLYMGLHHKEDPADQLTWLEAVLMKSLRNRETVSNFYQKIL